MSTYEEELLNFYKNINQEVINKSSVEGMENSRVSTFTQIYIDYLSEAGVIEDGNVFYSFHSKPGTKTYQANGFSLSEDESELTLFVSAFQNPVSLYTIAPSEARKLLDNAETFFKKSLDQLYLKLEEALEEFDVAKTIYDLRDTIQLVKIVLFTNGTIKSMPLNGNNDDRYSISYQIWDLDRIYRISTSGNAREKIEIDLQELAGQTLQCVKIAVPSVVKYDRGKEYHSGGYTSYFTVFPGSVLFKIYQAYNARLLEKNVRTFLQARGNVNKGIRDTIIQQPGMFLAYNNGISATAEAVTIIKDNGISCEISALKDFQIVNGGQTTASIFNTCKNNTRHLDNVYVQAKITVIDDPNNMEIMVPNISRYANTQNKIQNADFSANDLFHQEMEKISRTIWAPAKTGGEKQTKWFYERSRGQYNDSKNRARSENVFESEYPKQQYFDKLLLARLENIWEQFPYIASKGGQKSFAEFTLRLSKRGKFIPDQDYFKNIIAKAIIYREVRAIVKNQDFLGFWANVVDYSIAYLVFKAEKHIDLKQIWQTQDITSSIRECIPGLSKAVYDYIKNSAGGQNVTQWCKKKECWEGLKEKDIPLGGVPVEPVISPTNDTSAEDAENINRIKQVDIKLWELVHEWGRESKLLKGYQNMTIKAIIGYAKNNFQHLPSNKQAKQALEALKLAVDKGVVNDEEIIDLVK